MPNLNSTEVDVSAPRRVLLASLIGTTIEFFDFYIYATASVLVFPHLFFPQKDPAAATLASLATFGIAFLARPIGSAFFGHFGDRIGRKSSLIAALLMMGIPTVAIGLLPTYAAIGVAAPLLLALCRFAQGLGLGGEWGGAVLLAVENAPPNRRAWYGMFPQLGAPFGFFLSGATYLLLARSMTNEHFLAFGWRLPFLASAILVVVGLYVRLALTETPAFQQACARGEPVASPLLTLLRDHGRALVAGVLSCLSTFVLFYVVSVFALSWGTTELGFRRATFLLMQLSCVPLFALTIPVAAMIAERGRRVIMLLATLLIGVFGFIFAPVFSDGILGATVMMALGMSLMGLTWAPLGALMSDLFPTNVRYTGSSLALSLAGVLGASSAPYIAMSLARAHGLAFVGYYLTGAALLSLLGLAMTLSPRATRGDARARPS